MKVRNLLLLLAFCCLSLAVQAQFVSTSAYPKREFRAAWIQAVNGQFRGIPTDRLKQILINQLNSLQGAGINAVIFQVRPEADALYASQYEPWSRFLTGVQGKAPEPYWDPMQFMIDEYSALPSKPKIFLVYPVKVFKNNFGISDSLVQNGVIPLIRKVARKNKLQTIDLYSAFENKGNLMISDGIHPNREGAKVMAEVIGKAITDSYSEH